ncbi:SGNH/GDSL hydrolase family protein [Sphingobacterium daejeonense]|uniref:SGNH/GDSL hydrolase family protein n=1 Tax=Sphingobacterium daejeonense TaxID=371142 RepID=UPI0018D9B08F|nr:SGNH/GDSL hydrolase family protein [Sphingobacterium daejeonense]
MASLKNLIILSFALILFGCTHKPTMKPVKIHKGSRIVLIGNNLGSRMMEYGDFDTELHTRFPDSNLFIRNISSPGNTAGFRPHPSRNSPWAFPGAEKFNPEFDINTGSEGHFPTEDEWLTTLKPDVIIGFFGYNESFRGEEGLQDFKGEIAAFIDHTQNQDYNGGKGTQLILISPIAFEDLSNKYDLPDGKEINKNLKLYTDAMKQIAQEKKVPFLDVYGVTSKWIDQGSDDLTIDGSQLSEKSYARFAGYLVSSIFGKGDGKNSEHKDKIKAAVLEKDFIWTEDFKIPNGVHAYGRRFNPFGPEKLSV